MITTNDILSFLNSLAPAELAMSWDNVGLLCGKKAKEIHKILVALDPFQAVAEEAAAVGADLIVTHHPLIFVPPKSITDETSVGRTIAILMQNNISAINAHTNLDIAKGGVNDTLAAVLGLSDVRTVGKVNLLRMGTVPEQPLGDFLPYLKCKLNCPGLRYADGGKPVHLVAVGGGACASELMDAYDAGCDTFITSDVKYNDFWDAKDLGLTIIDAGHFYTENPIVDVLAAKLSANFPEISVVKSLCHRDCMKFF